MFALHVQCISDRGEILYQETLQNLTIQQLRNSLGQIRHWQSFARGVVRVVFDVACQPWQDNDE